MCKKISARGLAQNKWKPMLIDSETRPSKDYYIHTFIHKLGWSNSRLFFYEHFEIISETKFNFLMVHTLIYFPLNIGCFCLKLLTYIDISWNDSKAFSHIGKGENTYPLNLKLYRNELHVPEAFFPMSFVGYYHSHHYVQSSRY